ncbi:hypothetical protein [Formosa sp. A9]|uniref:hypothetical protein n=1 Tax=Formosa sp. A9 TaxID=3442641 RepID=UPI003EBB9321
MKKLVIASALVLGSVSVFSAAPYIINHQQQHVVVQDEYKEIAVTEVPRAVTDAVSQNFPSGTISKAYKNDANEYKLKIDTDGNSKTIYANEEGKILMK